MAVRPRFVVIGAVSAFGGTGILFLTNIFLSSGTRGPCRSAFQIKAFLASRVGARDQSIAFVVTSCVGLREEASDEKQESNQEPVRAHDI